MNKTSKSSTKKLSPAQKAWATRRANTEKAVSPAQRAAATRRANASKRSK